MEECSSGEVNAPVSSKGRTLQSACWTGQWAEVDGLHLVEKMCVCPCSTVFWLLEVLLGSSRRAQKLWGFKGKPLFRPLSPAGLKWNCDLHQSTGRCLFSPSCRLCFKLWIKADSISCLLKSSCCNPFKVLLPLKNHEAPSSAASKAEV